jgi:multicomponent K+:H+ antiporter subunit A/multicomponent Na+:H+ antiporter subunit A
MERLPHFCIFAAVFLPLLAALPVALLGRRLGRRVAWVALLFPMLSTLAILGAATRLEPGDSFTSTLPWVPSLGLNLDFLVDGLSLFFGLVVSGMGCLIFFYAAHYLDDHDAHQGRFYSYLLLFMAAMLGTVFANHALLLFIFWELTGLASFLLIGFNHDEEHSRRGARMALLVTAATGLVLMLGVILLGQGAGTFRLDELLAQRATFAGKDWLNAAFLLVAVGAFGKSAQFPFHFWLPNAMAAPTPVSAYLHSATMVKLGVFLIARVLPVFQASEWWLPLLAGIGFTTMLLGALLALLSHDLKAVLAFATVSTLGFLIGNYGLAPTTGTASDHLHIASHVLFKGCLFMCAGIIDHATGTRDLRQLGGLWRRLPLLGIVLLIAAASMAGVIGTLGFLSKEAMLKDLFARAPQLGNLGTFCLVAALLASLFKVAFSARLFLGVFRGPEPAAVREHFHAPGLGMQLPPMLLAGATVLLGLAPALLDRPVDFLRVAGLHADEPSHLMPWHGWNRELLTSAALLAAGLAVYALGRATRWRWGRIPAPMRFDAAFERGVEAFGKVTKTATRVFGADSPTLYLPIVLGFIALVVGGWVLWHLPLGEWRRMLREGFANHHWSGLRVLTALLIALGSLGAVWLRQWTAQIISLSAAGFLTCFYFVLYRAPDLALTQILIETVTLILVLYLLGRFPQEAQRGEEDDRRFSLRRAGALGIAVLVGLMMTGLSLMVTDTPATARLGEALLQETVPLAEGANAVNTVLVDFRGFDTFGEITVLLVAMLGVLGLMMRRKRTAEEFRQGPLGAPGYGIDLEDRP